MNINRHITMSQGFCKLKVVILRKCLPWFSQIYMQKMCAGSPRHPVSPLRAWTDALQERGGV